MGLDCFVKTFLVQCVRDCLLFITLSVFFSFILQTRFRLSPPDVANGPPAFEASRESNPWLTQRDLWRTFTELSFETKIVLEKICLQTNPVAKILL